MFTFATIEERYKTCPFLAVLSYSFHKSEVLRERPMLVETRVDMVEPPFPTIFTWFIGFKIPSHKQLSTDTAPHTNSIIFFLPNYPNNYTASILYKI